MSVTRGSVTLQLILRLWAVLRTAWADSRLGGWCRRRVSDIRAALPGSVTARVARREGAVGRSWDAAWTRTAFDAVWNLPVTLLGKLRAALRPVWDGSAAVGALTWLGSRGWLLLGGFALLMLVAPHALWDNLYAFLLAAAVYACFAVGAAGRGERLETRSMGPWFALYVLFITAGLLISLDRSLSLRFYLFHLTCFLITLVLVSAIRSYRQLRILLTLAAAGLAVASLYGCYQGIVGVEVVASQQDVSLNAGMPGRVYSFYDNPNNFAEILVLLLPLTAVLTLTARRPRGKALGALALGAGVVALGMTYSRSSWIGLVLAVVVALALINWRLLPALLVLAVAAIPFLPQTIWNRILTIGNMEDSSARYRIAIYEDTFRLLRDHGLAGVGLGSDVMGRVFRSYPTLYDGNYPIHTHNNYFQMWGEVGIFGLIAYLGLVLGKLKEAVLVFRRADRQLRYTLAAAAGSLVGILAIGLVEYTWFYPRNMFLFWFLFAILSATINLIRQQPAE